MKKQYLFILSALGAVSAAHAQEPALKGTVIVKSLYQNRLLQATTSIELRPGFSVSIGGFEARIVPDPVTAGCWTTPQPWWLPVMNESFVGIHTHLLPNGKVLSWEGHNTDQHITGAHAATWNPFDNFFTEFNNTASNIFCSGHAFTSDGKLFVAGGRYSDGTTWPTPMEDPTMPRTPMAGYIGLKDANTFNWLATTQPNGAPWTVLDEMADRRWYPTVTTLIDGRMLTIAGQRYGGLHSVIPEIWNNGTWSRLLNAANLELKDYPWMFAAPNDPVTGQGRVFYAGPTWDSRYLNTSTGVWSTTIYPTRYNQPRHPSLWREAGSAVMFDKGKILVVGGGIDTNIDNTAEWIDLTAAVPTWRPAGTMQFARKHVNATLLPDGRVLITGGTRTGSINEFDAVLVPEIWTPPTTPTGPGTWNTVPLAPMQVPRLYHSTALLLPDGRVLSTGGGAGGNFERHADYEVYSPPYLCGTAPRPQITGAPVAMQYGQPFSVTVTDAAGANIAIGSLRLIRLASVTHSFDMNQRGLTLPFAQAGNALSTTAPLNDWCPPGHYLLFAVSSAGVPSEARIVSVTPNPCGVSLNLTVSSQPPTTSCATQRLVTASGLNLGNAYEWTIDGVAVPNNSTSSLSLTQGLEGSSQFQNRVRVSVTPTCGGPPATATVLVTSYFPDCQFR